MNVKNAAKMCEKTVARMEGFSLILLQLDLKNTTGVNNISTNEILLLQKYFLV